MKRIILLGIMIFAVCFLAGCGNQTEKYADRMERDYFKPAEEIFFEAFDNDILKRVGSQKDYDKHIDRETINNKYLPDVNALNEKFGKEKADSDAVALHTGLKNMLQSLNDVMNLASKVNADRDLNKDLDEAFLRVISDYYQCRNELSLIKTKKSSYELTARNFQQIQQGDTYFDVVNIFKMPGNLTSSDQYRDLFKGNIIKKTYKWDNGKGSAIIEFKNGKVDSMRQDGLE